MWFVSFFSGQKANELDRLNYLTQMSILARFCGIEPYKRWKQTNFQKEKNENSNKMREKMMSQLKLEFLLKCSLKKDPEKWKRSAFDCVLWKFRKIIRRKWMWWLGD